MDFFLETQYHRARVCQEQVHTAPYSSIQDILWYCIEE